MLYIFEKACFGNVFLLFLGIVFTVFQQIYINWTAFTLSFRAVRLELKMYTHM